MNLLVDSTVWIDLFRGRETGQTAKLEHAVKNGDLICYCGFIFTEVLQGIRDEKQYVATKREFETLVYLEDERSTFDLGATIYRDLKRKGLTIRNSIDCLITAIAIQHDVSLLENDRDFHFIGEHYPLKLI